MRASEVKVDLQELKDFKKQNAKERLEFISYWANYVKTHSDRDWGSKQNVLINSQFD